MNEQQLKVQILKAQLLDAQLLSVQLLNVQPLIGKLPIDGTIHKTTKYIIHNCTPNPPILAVTKRVLKCEDTHSYH